MSEERIGAVGLIQLIADESSFSSWVTEIDHANEIDEIYQAKLLEARERSGSFESVVAGSAKLDGKRVVLIVGNFDFMGGSIGLAASRIIISAIQRATTEALPIVAIPNSGGTRIQEGTNAFTQIIGITQALIRHRQSKLPYIVYLRNPTTGGVLASWGALGHVTYAEPRAFLGFLGPRVYKALNREEFPPGIQCSENLLKQGIVDSLVAPSELRICLIKTLALMLRNTDLMPSIENHQPTAASPKSLRKTGIEAVGISRATNRIGTRDIINFCTNSFVFLSDTTNDPTRGTGILALARFGEINTVLFGHDRAMGKQGLTTNDLNLAKRGMRLATELSIPFISVIDTPGAELSVTSENSGLSSHIAKSIMSQLEVETPVITLLLGQGVGGGALATFPADQVLSLENAWLSPLPPEGASVIMYRDLEHTGEMMNSQGITAKDLLDNGIVNRIIMENEPATEGNLNSYQLIAQALEQELLNLILLDDSNRLVLRAEKYLSALVTIRSSHSRQNSAVMP